MPNKIAIDDHSYHVVSELHRLIGASLGPSRIPMAPGWTPHTVTRGGMAHLLRVSNGGPMMAPAKWGRSSRGSDKEFVDSSSPGQVRRGLIVVSALFKDVPTGFATWDKRTHRVSMNSASWFTVGCSWNDEGGSPEFSILTMPTGSDLANIFPGQQPIVVPASKRAEWLNPSVYSDFWFPPAGGTFSAVPV